MTPTRARYDGVVAALPVSIPYERYSTHAAHWWLGRALGALIRQAGIAKTDVDGLCVSSFTLAPDTAVGLTQHLGMSPRWLDHIPMGGASGVAALRRAARAVQAGDAGIVACIAGDTNQVDSFRNTVSQFSRFAQDAVYPYGAGGPNASFALLTAHYMRSTGATREDFGKVCVAQRDNALRYPHALMKKPLTLRQYLDARVITDPIHLFDCVMPCAGADGFLVMSEDRARALNLPYARILSTIERHNAWIEDPIQTRGGWTMDIDELYGMADAAPADMDFLQAYDDYPVINLMQMEDLGFCAKGEAPGFVRANTFTVDGSLPFNTNGGQLSVGQAGAAGGYLGMVEALRQLTGTAGGTQVADARPGPGQRLRHDQLRPRPVHRRGHPGQERRMTEPLAKPPRKNPVARTRQPTLPPGARSRAALGLTAAAAEGRFELQACADCGAVQYPPREVCGHCLSERLPWRPVDPDGVLLVSTTLHHSNDLYFRERLPWRVGTVRMDAGPSVVAHVHQDCADGARVRLALKLDRSGQAVMIALPEEYALYSEDDKTLRETSCDPKFRRALVTDGKSAVGQAVARALLDAGCPTSVVPGRPAGAERRDAAFEARWRPIRGCRRWPWT